MRKELAKEGFSCCIIVVKTLLIDDLRNMDVTRTARNYNDGIEALKEGGWEVLYLDHDLADYSEGVERTGYDVMCWIEVNPELKPGRIEIVSQNPVGRQKMDVVINKLYGN